MATSTSELSLQHQAAAISYSKLVGSYIEATDIPLLHRAYLDWQNEPKEEYIRKTSIIATIGPKTASVESIINLRAAGMNIVRLNFSHGTHEYHGSVVNTVRQSFVQKPGRPVAIAVDTKGPEIRTGLMKDDKGFAFKTGHKMMFSTDEKYKEIGAADVIHVDYKNLPHVMSPGKFIFIDDGTLQFKVLEVRPDGVFVEALNSGTLLSKKGVNLPSTNVDLPAVSEKDKLDLQFAVKYGVDMVFASFIRSAEDIQTIRSLLGEKGKDGSIKVIAKIENHQGLENFDSILKAADGIMVARGDLGTEIPSWKVFVAQKSMVAKCNIAGKSCIVATQMMQSMTACPKPTRAEASDVANAVLDGCDAVMLSAETASGDYPIEAVTTMARICLEAESIQTYSPFFTELKSLTPKPLMTTETIAVAAVNASLEENANVIIVLSTSGQSARLISKYRPRACVLVVTRDEGLARITHLWRGCYPLLYKTPPSVSSLSSTLPSSPMVKSLGSKELELWQGDVDCRIDFGMSEAKKMGLCKDGDPIICIQGWRPGTGKTNCMRILQA